MTRPRRVVRPGRTVAYKVSIRPVTKQKGKAKAKANGAAGPNLNLRVVLPIGVRYMKSGTRPSFLTYYDAQGRKARRQPVQSNDSMVLTWENIGATHRTFKVKARVDSAFASGTQLTFSAQLFESVTVGAGSIPVPACPQPAPNVTVTVV